MLCPKCFAQLLSPKANRITPSHPTSGVCNCVDSGGTWPPVGDPWRVSIHLTGTGECPHPTGSQRKHKGIIKVSKLWHWVILPSLIYVRVWKGHPEHSDMFLFSNDKKKIGCFFFLADRAPSSVLSILYSDKIISWASFEYHFVVTPPLEQNGLWLTNSGCVIVKQLQWTKKSNFQVIATNYLGVEINSIVVF